MESLSEKYGWTPQQIREMSEDDVIAYLDIAKIKLKYRTDEVKKINRKK